MGLFEGLPFMPKGAKSDEKQQIKAENREREFIRERDTSNAALQEDQSYMYEREQRNELLRWQQELDDELFGLVKDLLGLEERDDGWKKTSEPLCNMLFIKQVVVPQCKPSLSRNLINSNYDQKNILMKLRSIISDIINAMSDNYDLYGIEFTNFDLVLRTIQGTIEPSFYRALKGWTKKIDNTSVKRIESFNEQQKEKKKGLFGSGGS